MNKVILTGRIGRDAEVKQIGNSYNISFSLATSERYTKDGERRETTEWHNITAWGERWLKLAQYLTKGKLVTVEGRIHYRESINGESKRHYTDIEMRDVELLGGGEPQPAATQIPKATAENLNTIFGNHVAQSTGDLPF